MNKTRKRKAQGGVVNGVELAKLEQPKKQRRNLSSDIQSHHPNQIWGGKEWKSGQFGVDFGTVGAKRKVFERGNNEIGVRDGVGDRGKIKETTAQPKVSKKGLDNEEIEFRKYGNPKGKKPDQQKDRLENKLITRIMDYD